MGADGPGDYPQAVIVSIAALGMVKFVVLPFVLKDLATGFKLAFPWWQKYLLLIPLIYFPVGEKGKNIKKDAPRSQRWTCKPPKSRKRLMIAGLKAMSIFMSTLSTSCNIKRVMGVHLN